MQGTILITGADGVVGSYFESGIKLSREMLDVTDLCAVLSACEAHHPAVIVHAAALTDLSVCEKDPERAYMVNAVGTYHMALAARRFGAKLIYISTSGVFDGKKSDPYTESDVPNPQGIYAHSKYLGELAVAGMLEDHCVVRASWMFGGGKEGDKKFVGKMLGQLALGASELSVIGGRRGSPTYAKDLVQGIERLIKEDVRGIVHMGNAGSATRVELAEEIVKITAASARVIEMPDTAFAAEIASARTAGNESMSSSLAYMRPWQEALREYIQKEWQGILRSAA